MCQTRGEQLLYRSSQESSEYALTSARLKLTFHRRFSALHNVHPAETFPLALASGAVIQQIIFVAVQSTSLQRVLSDQCRSIAMVTFPG